MALPTSNLSVKLILQTLGVATARAIFYNGGSLKTISELGATVSKAGLSQYHCPGADPDARLNNLRNDRKLSYFKGYVHAFGLTLTPDTFSVEGNEQQLTIAVETDGSTTWTVTTKASWINLSTTSGTGNSNIDFTVEQNATPISRTGRIFVDGSNGVSSVCVIYQTPA